MVPQTAPNSCLGFVLRELHEILLLHRLCARGLCPTTSTPQVWESWALCLVTWKYSVCFRFKQYISGYKPVMSWRASICFKSKSIQIKKNKNIVTHTHIYVCAHMHTQINIAKHTQNAWTLTYTHTCLDTWMHIHKHKHTHAQTPTHRHPHMRVLTHTT